MKTRETKTFDEIYDELVEGQKCAIDKLLAHNFYKAGMDNGLGEFMMNMAKNGALFNAREVSCLCEVNYYGTTYQTKLTCSIQKAGEITIDEIAEKTAENMMKEAGDNNLKDILKKAILSGYEIRRQKNDE